MASTAEQSRPINRETPVAIGLVVILSGAVFSAGAFWSKWEALEKSHRADVARLELENQRLEEKTDRKFSELQRSIENVGEDVSQVKNFLMRNPGRGHERN